MAKPINLPALSNISLVIRLARQITPFVNGQASSGLISCEGMTRANFVLAYASAVGLARKLRRGKKGEGPREEVWGGMGTREEDQKGM